jgi:hypothetical protein
VEVRRILATVTGVAQGVLGVMSMVFALLLYFNILEVQAMFNMPSELLPLYLMIFALFSLFSVISGFYLIREERAQIKKEERSVG